MTKTLLTYFNIEIALLHLGKNKEAESIHLKGIELIKKDAEERVSLPRRIESAIQLIKSQKEQGGTSAESEHLKNEADSVLSCLLEKIKSIKDEDMICDEKQ